MNITQLVTFDGESTDIPFLKNKLNFLKTKGWVVKKKPDGFFKKNIYCYYDINISGSLYDKKIHIKMSGGKLKIDNINSLKSFFKKKFNIDL